MPPQLTDILPSLCNAEQYSHNALRAFPQRFPGGTLHSSALLRGRISLPGAMRVYLEPVHDRFVIIITQQIKHGAKSAGYGCE